MRISKQPDNLAFTPAAGARLDWHQLPETIRRTLEARLGAAVTQADTQPGGFSPGVAARLRLADGRRAFVKVVSVKANPDTPGMHRREARGDIRADNVVHTPTRVFFVDWPLASRGAAWVDLLLMLPSVAMQRGPKPWQIFDHHPLGLAAPADAVTAARRPRRGSSFGSRGCRIRQAYRRCAPSSVTRPCPGWSG